MAMSIHVSTLGFVPLEQYVACVTTAENGLAAPAALRAQAIAARTFVLRAMRDRPDLGTSANPIPNSNRFQVYVHTPSKQAVEATSDTAGLVCRYMGELIICNFVAGALWTKEGKPGQDPTETEKWVTYNEGRTGPDVRPSPISLPTRKDNRGCMSQNGSDWLARHGRDYGAILRYFYGADLAIEPLDPPGLAENPSAPRMPQAQQPAQEAPPARSSSSPLPLLAAIAAALLGDSK